MEGSDTAEHREAVKGQWHSWTQEGSEGAVAQPGSEVRWESESGHRAYIRGTALVYRDLQRQNKPLDELASPPSK